MPSVTRRRADTSGYTAQVYPALFDLQACGEIHLTVRRLRNSAFRISWSVHLECADVDDSGELLSNTGHAETVGHAGHEYDLAAGDCRRRV